ncbi:hypothetical protein EDD99_5058 [Streptomyces sp. 846.5]|nr:hypothetical protein [Streptomyces sp. 846.5]TDU06499.1 hypothetical protein EDD99_5058 [Streptomyces sp. 846.5]
MSSALWKEPSLSPPVEIVWDRPAMLWRLTISGEGLRDGGGELLGWDSFTAAFDARQHGSGVVAEALREREIAMAGEHPQVPEVGAWVVDTRTDRTAVVTDVRDGRLYLRPASGFGEEWEAMPAHVRSTTEREKLSGRVSEANFRSQHMGWM